MNDGSRRTGNKHVIFRCLVHNARLHKNMIETDNDHSNNNDDG